MNLQRKQNKLKGYQFYKDLSAEKEVPKWFMLMLVNRTIKPKKMGSNTTALCSNTDIG